MSVPVDAPRTRRALLTAGIGAVAASVVTAVGRPRPVAAAGNDGETLVVGGFYDDVQSQTTIANQANNEIVLWVASNAGGAGGSGTAVVGYSADGVGVHGLSTDGIGVKAESSTDAALLATSTSGTGVAASSASAPGVNAFSGAHWAVRGRSNSTAFAAVQGEAHGYATGVLGYSGHSETTPASLAEVGVYGHTSVSASGRGVVGSSVAGTGVHGFSGSTASPPPKVGVYGFASQDGTSRGVVGRSTSGQGVRGEVTTGAALYGSASSKSGFALKTSGRLSLGKVSGVATIAAGATASAAIPTGVAIATTAYVVVSPQSDPGTRRFWATKDTTADTVTVRTNTTSASAIKVAWLLIG